MMKKFLLRLSGALLALMVTCVASSAAFASATIVIENGDSGPTGFNDPTPVSPVGGNSGTTLGEQRLIAFQAAANIWGATLTSGPTITIRASWAALPCTANSATLGSAGNNGNIWRDFAGAPLSATWYGNALANALSGTDQNGLPAEINAQFNVNLGMTGCLENAHWYYGLDNNHGVNGVDLVAVVMHEFAHGLGFQTFTSSSTGQQAGSAQNGFFPSIYDRFLFDNTAAKTWPQMTDGERATSAINTGQLAWNGPQVTGDAPGVLAGTPRLWVNSPPAIGGNYQIGAADFGPPLSSPGITANVVQATPNDGCSALTNAAAVSGKIALIDRGNCTFVTKVKNAQNAGAVGVIIADNVVNSTPPGMGGSDPTITIPSVSITMADGNTIKGQLPNVNATLFIDGSATAGADQFGRPLLFTPNPVQGGSSVSHWDSSALPNQLMEPNISSDLSHSVSPPQDLTASLMRDIGWQTTIVAAPTVQFQTAGVSVNEGGGSVTVTVNRTDTSGAATVDYRTSDTDTFTVGCADTVNNQGSAYGRCDYATSNDTLSFAPGEPSKSFVIPIINDGHVEGPETFQVVLSNPSTGLTLGTPATATVTINDNDTTGTPNPILASDDAGIAFFVRQHYLDFLAREPELGEPWSPILRGCPDQFNFDPTTPSAGCDRITVSGSFFGSPEFLNKGVYVIVFYRVAFIRLPQYAEFAPDLRSVTGATQAETFAKRAAFANNFVLRPEFASLAAMSNTDYVNTLMGRYGLTSITTPDPANPDLGGKVTLTSAQMIAALNGATLTRAQVLRAIVQSDQVSLNFEAVTAFVASQYYGYLRRTPDTAGFNQWVTHLSQNPNDFRTMVNGFVNSQEYRLRFGP